MKIIGSFFTGVAAVTLAILALHNIVPTASAQATRVVTITDPVLNMQAYSLSIPANWISVSPIPCVGLCRVGFLRAGRCWAQCLPRCAWESSATG